MIYCIKMVVGAVLVTGVGISQVGMDDGAGYRKQMETWRQHRVERLTAPSGWLSLVALDWLKDGANTLGSASDNTVVLAEAPPRLGTITLAQGKATIALDAKAEATIDGAKKSGAELLDDSHAKPTTVAFGSVSFYLVQRGDKFLAGANCFRNACQCSRAHTRQENQHIESPG